MCSVGSSKIFKVCMIRYLWFRVKGLQLMGAGCRARNLGPVLPPPSLARPLDRKWFYYQGLWVNVRDFRLGGEESCYLWIGGLRVWRGSE